MNTTESVPSGNPVPGPSLGKAVAIIIIAALFSYFSSLHGAFIFDDNRFLADPNIDRPLRSEMAPRPVVAVSLTVNHLLDGFNPRGYHALNLAVHAAAAVTLFALVRFTLLLPKYGSRYAARAGWIGLATALIWVVHPLNTQAVTYVIQRCESMMGFFFLLSLYCYARGAVAERSGWWYAAAIVSCALGAGCKEMTIALPIVALLYDRAFLSGSWRAAAARWRPLVGLAIPPLLGTTLLLFGGILNEATVGFKVNRFTPLTYALTETQVILYYLRLAVWPAPLCMDYLDWEPATSVGQTWPTVLGLALLLVVTAVGVATRRGWGVAAAAFFLVLAPTSSIVPIADVAFEHRMYLPLAALVVLVVVGAADLTEWLSDRFPRYRALAYRTAAALAGLIVVVLGIATAARNEDYASVMGFWQDNVAKRPSNARARADLAKTLLFAGRPDAAAAQMRAAIQLPVQPVGSELVYLVTLRNSADAEEAVTAARSYLQRFPESGEYEMQLGMALLELNKPAEAEPVLRNAARRLEKEPDSTTLFDGYKYGTGKVPAVTRRPEVAARLHLGCALLALGKTDLARAEFAAVRTADPAYVKSLATSARTSALDPNEKPEVLRMAGLYAEAAVFMTDEKNAHDLDTLAIAQARLGRYPAAAATADRAADRAEADSGDQEHPYHAKLMRERATLFRSGKAYLPENRTQ